ncbi:MAG: hypothetical protein R3C68_04410 [Myxococcota bacterium]
MAPPVAANPLKVAPQAHPLKLHSGNNSGVIHASSASFLQLNKSTTTSNCPSSPNHGSGRSAALKVGTQAVGPLPPPATPQVQLREELHGELVADPYRWLELPFSQEQAVMPYQERQIEIWVSAQSDRFVQAIKQRPDLLNYVQSRFYDLSDRPRSRWPQEAPELGQVQWRRESAADPWRLHLLGKDQDPNQLDLFAEGDVLIDERVLGETLHLPKGAFVDDTAFSPDGRHVAISISEYNGDDRRKIAIMDVATRKFEDNLLVGVKSTSLFWLDNNRLLYGVVDMSAEDLRKNAPDVFHFNQVHELGKPQSEDFPLFKRRRSPGNVKTYGLRESIMRAVRTSSVRPATD